MDAGAMFDAFMDPKTKKLRGVYSVHDKQQVPMEDTVILMNPDAVEMNHEELEWFDEGCDPETDGDIVS